MIFFDERNIRRWIVWPIGLACATAVVFFAWKVSQIPSDPNPVCPDCAYSDYLRRQPAKQIALTFDDGPIAEHTPKILDTLDKHDVRATFFILGQQAVREPDILRDISRRGHGIGNHTFTHEPTVHATEERLAWELNATNRAIESITGHSAILYRPPYLLDLDDREVRPIFSEEPVWEWADAHGYVPVGADLDPFDWRTDSSEEIVADVRRLLDAHEANPAVSERHVFLFHDSEKTADALDDVLVLLESRGYEVVPLEQLLGMTKEETMPAVSTHTDTARDMVAMFATMWPAAMVCIMLLSIAAVLRPFALLAVREFVRECAPLRSARVKKGDIRVSVLVPAYNEQANVRSTLRSILDSTRQPEEIIVINDGSADSTQAVALGVAGMQPGLIHVMSQQNAGKAAALNAGIARSTGDILVMIDGDTALHPECIERIVEKFSDTDVGAVAGRIVPASPRTILERFQEIEYVVGQSVDKEAFSRFGAVSVVPGAIGAWRRDVVEQAGGYSADTLVEDQDLTLAVLALGYKVSYAADAIAYTEAPTTLYSFFLQRYRWVFGTLQCVWKYRTYTFSRRVPRLGFGVLPYAALYNAILPTVAVAIQITLVIGTITHLLNPALLFLVPVFLLDVGYALVAMQGAGQKKSNIALVPLQRLLFVAVYTGLSLLVTLKMLDGTRTRWNSFVRKGSAARQYAENVRCAEILREQKKIESAVEGAVAHEPFIGNAPLNAGYASATGPLALEPRPRIATL